MLFQEPSILKYFSAFGANNQPHRLRRLDACYIIASSETILNIVKNFVRKIFQAIRKFFNCTPSFIRGSLRPCAETKARCPKTAFSHGSKFRPNFFAWLPIILCMLRYLDNTIQNHNALMVTYWVEKTPKIFFWTNFSKVR